MRIKVRSGVEPRCGASDHSRFSGAKRVAVSRAASREAAHLKSGNPLGQLAGSGSGGGEEPVADGGGDSRPVQTARGEQLDRIAMIDELVRQTQLQHRLDD